jgi:hypothetical protein
MHFVRALLVAAVGVSVGHAGDATDDGQVVIDKALQLMESARYAEAVPLLKDVTSRMPYTPSGFWNLGVAAAASGDQLLALQAYIRYHEIAPNDPHGLSKLVQTYQALGRLTERDQVRDQLMAFRTNLPPKERDQFAFYVRDQFDVGRQHFMVLEYFEPRGPNRLYYKFTAVDSSHKALYDFTLSSTDAESTAARELGQIGKDDRLYGLDKNEGGTSMLCRLMTLLPSYDAIRACVIDAVSDTNQPQTSCSETKQLVDVSLHVCS